jgi:hypothetical protein
LKIAAIQLKVIMENTFTEKWEDNGQWAAPFLLFGLYNKLVKVTGHDRDSNQSDESDPMDMRMGSD